MTITEFLTARYDEEEAETRAATPGPWRAVDAEECGAEVYTAGGKAVACSREGGGVDLEDARHIARHDPARVLREVAAKRAVLVLHSSHWSGDCWSCSGDHGADPTPAPCDTLRHLAAVHADHPDYRQEWAP